MKKANRLFLSFCKKKLCRTTLGIFRHLFPKNIMTQRHWICNKSNGFTLIEVSMSLIILGIIAGLSLPLMTTLIQLEKNKRTETHREQIMAALAYYVLYYGKFPCPSRPGSFEGKATVEECNSNHAKCIGIVPYGTLALPEKIAKDGYDNWFTYAVEPALTNTDRIGYVKNKNAMNFDYKIETDIAFSDKPGNHIKLYSTLDEKPLLKSGLGIIAVILISHGPNGSGAFYPHKNERMAAFNPLENKNSLDNLTFYVGTTPDFHHNVTWVNKAFFLSYYCQMPHKTNIYDKNYESQFVGNNKDNINKVPKPGFGKF